MKRFERPQGNQEEESSAKRRKVGKDQNRLQAEDAQRQETRGEGAAAQQHWVHDFARPDASGSQGHSAEAASQKRTQDSLASIVSTFRELHPKGGGEQWNTQYVQHLTSGFLASLERSPESKIPGERGSKTPAHSFNLEVTFQALQEGVNIKTYAKEMEKVTVKAYYGGNPSYNWEDELDQEQGDPYNQQHTEYSAQPQQQRFSQSMVSYSPHIYSSGDSSPSMAYSYPAPEQYSSVPAYSGSASMTGNMTYGSASMTGNMTYGSASMTGDAIPTGFVASEAQVYAQQPDGSRPLEQETSQGQAQKIETRDMVRAYLAEEKGALVPYDNNGKKVASIKDILLNAQNQNRDTVMDLDYLTEKSVARKAKMYHDVRVHPEAYPNGYETDGWQSGDDEPLRQQRGPTFEDTYGDKRSSENSKRADQKLHGDGDLVRAYLKAQCQIVVPNRKGNERYRSARQVLRKAQEMEPNNESLKGQTAASVVQDARAWREG